MCHAPAHSASELILLGNKSLNILHKKLLSFEIASLNFTQFQARSSLGATSMRLRECFF